MSTTETQLERTVREEQEAHDAANDVNDDEQLEDDAPAVDPDGKKLFNDADYEREDLAISKVDGNQIDRIAIKFAGEVFLDRSDPEDVALFNRMKLGQDVTLQVEAKCSGVAARGATDREGDLDVVVGQRSVKVHTVYLSVADGVAKQAA
jgi:hypothetical protein